MINTDNKNSSFEKKVVDIIKDCRSYIEEEFYIEYNYLSMKIWILIYQIPYLNRTLSPSRPVRKRKVRRFPGRRAERRSVPLPSDGGRADR